MKPDDFTAAELTPGQRGLYDRRIERVFRDAARALVAHDTDDREGDS